MKDTLVIGGHEFQSRFILGSGKYSLDLINAAVQNAGAQIITLALRRANEGGTANILDYIPEGVTLLPNTSGARNADEAVRIARLLRAAAAISSRSKLCATASTCCRTIRRPSARPRSLRKRASSLCRICTPI